MAEVFLQFGLGSVSQPVESQTTVGVDTLGSHAVLSEVVVLVVDELHYRERVGHTLLAFHAIPVLELVQLQEEEGVLGVLHSQTQSGTGDVGKKPADVEVGGALRFLLIVAGAVVFVVVFLQPLAVMLRGGFHLGQDVLHGQRDTLLATSLMGYQQTIHAELARTVVGVDKAQPSRIDGVSHWYGLRHCTLQQFGRL